MLRPMRAVAGDTTMHHSGTRVRDPSQREASLARMLHRSSDILFIIHIVGRLAGSRLLFFLGARSRAGRCIRYRLRRMSFQSRTFRHNQRERTHAALVASDSTVRLLKLSVLPAVFAALAFLILWGATYAYQFAQVRFTSLPDLPRVDPGMQASILGTLAQALAAILALFFATISVIASTSYAKLATTIRTLVAYDNLNRRYLGLLAHATALSIIALVSQCLGHTPSVLIVTYIAGLAVLGILCLFAVGARTFALFNPASLAVYPLAAFHRALRIVEPPGWRWLLPSLQAHASTIARHQLDVIEELVTSAISDDHPSMRHAVHELALHVHRLLRLYASHKSHIPMDSLWYARKAQFTRLHLDSGSATEIALRTGTTPPAQAVPNYQFVENRCDKLLLRCFDHTLENGSTDDALVQLNEFSKTVGTRATLLQHEESIALAAAVCDAVVGWLIAHPGSKTTSPSTLHVTDLACVIALTPVRNTTQALLRSSSSQLPTLVEAVLQCDSTRIHNDVVPQSVLKDLESLLRIIGFERTAEGTVLTPAWYVAQLIAADYATYVRGVVRTITSSLEDLFLTLSRRLLDGERAAEANAWLQRGIEACSEAEHQITGMSTLYATLKTRHRTEAPWSPLNEAVSLDRVATVRSDIIRLIAKSVPTLLKAPTDESMPDLLGQARVWLGEELVSLMENRRSSVEEFMTLFAAHFEATVAVAQSAFNLARGAERADFSWAAFDAMLDTLELSGLAILFSELDSTPYREPVHQVWAKYLASSHPLKGVLAAWLQPLENQPSVPLFSSSSTQRFHWERRFASILKDRGAVPTNHYFSFTDTKERSHPSPIIRSLNVHMGHLFTSPAVYFAAIYLADRALAEDLTLPSDVSECHESIKLEQEPQEDCDDV